MIPLKYNTAGQEIPLGPFVDSTDGDTEETGLTIANTDIKLWKAGATSLANKNSGGATHMANGEYYCVLDATDTNTYGPLKVRVHVAGALAVQVYCCVMEADAYDALYAAAGTGHIEADAVQAGGTAWGSGAITASSIASNALTAAKIAASALDGKGDWGDATAAELAKVPKSDGTATFNATALASINGEVDTALADYDGPTKAELDSGLAGLNDLDAAGIRTALGLATANLDTQLDALPTAAENRVEMDSNSTQLAAIVADTNELQTDDVPGLIAALNDISVNDVLTTAMTESYNADGSPPTVAQAFHLIISYLMERSVSGTTVTSKRLDGSTTAATFTLDDGTSPTSITRSS